MLSDKPDHVHATAYALVALFVYARLEELLLWCLSFSLGLAQIQCLPTQTLS